MTFALQEDHDMALDLCQNHKDELSREEIAFLNGVCMSYTCGVAYPRHRGVDNLAQIYRRIKRPAD